MDETKIKEIVSVFININPEEINADTKIDRSVIKSSVLIQRMYSELRQYGLNISNHSKITTFGDLVNGNCTNNKTIAHNDNSSSEADESPTNGVELLGVDLENINNLPKATDYRTHPFYRNTFSEKEISYCIAQQNPLYSFTGKYAAKEALIKINPKFGQLPMNKIEILNNNLGKPYVKGYSVSISHSDDFAIAVAIKIKSLYRDQNIDDEKSKNIQSRIECPSIDNVNKRVTFFSMLNHFIHSIF